MKKNYYQILELKSAQGSTSEEIKKAYRRLSKKYHPDANPGNREAEERFREISEAYAVLGDEEKRKKYDDSLRTSGCQKEKQQNKKAGGNSGSRTPQNYEFDINHMSANFERFFGFHPKSGEIKEEQWNKNRKKSTNPLDVSDMFEKYMGIKK